MENESTQILFTLTQKIFAIKCYYQHNENTDTVLECLRYRYGRIFDSKSSCSGIRQIVRNFETTGSVRHPVHHGSNEVIEKPIAELEILELAEDELVVEEIIFDSETLTGPVLSVTLKSERQGQITEQPDHDEASTSSSSGGGDKEEVPQQLEEEQQESKPKEDKLCPHCGICVAARSYRAHIKTHDEPPPRYICEVCNREFANKYKFEVHSKTHLPLEERLVDKIVCETCGKVSLTKELHKSHQRVHSSDRPYPCPHCEMSFKTLQSQKKHVQTHTGEKNLVCKVCEARFRAHTTLKMHMRLHTGERPYICDHCGKRFIGAPGLNVSRDGWVGGSMVNGG